MATIRNNNYDWTGTAGLPSQVTTRDSGPMVVAPGYPAIPAPQFSTLIPPYAQGDVELLILNDAAVQVLVL